MSYPYYTLVERRKERRYPIDQEARLVELTYVDGGPCSARVLDVSKSGLRVRLDRELSRRTQVEVRWPATAVFGEVCHCRQVACGHWEVGILIDQVIYGHPEISNDHLSRDTMALFLTGKLPLAEAGRAGAHLQECLMCKHTLGKVEDCSARLNAG